MSHNGLTIDVALLTNVNVLASVLNRYEAMYAEVPPARTVKLTMASYTSETKKNQERCITYTLCGLGPGLANRCSSASEANGTPECNVL